MDQLKEKKTYWSNLLLLILAGEAVFILPFVIPRIFRPTLMETFAINNVELGLCFSVYGIVAMVSYLLGGPLADKYSPRKLIAIALWVTALGGMVLAQYPQKAALQLLYAFWGFTTIFLFWAPMIKATRIWGGTENQGKAFGFLDGGRGLVGALFGLLGVLVFASILTNTSAMADLTQIKNAFSTVIYTCTGIIAVIGLMVWFFMKEDENVTKYIRNKIVLADIRQVLQLPAVWLLMLIVLCAYVGYKITDVLSLYAEQVMLYNAVDAAKTGTFLQFLRPITGFVLGIAADYLNNTKLLVWGFVTTFMGSLLFASGILGPNTTTLFFLSVLVLAIGVYACRTLYFAVMQAGQIPLTLTGSAVGIISLIGFSPDIFAGPVYGYFLDTYPGEEGYTYVFLGLCIFAGIGGGAAYIYARKFGDLPQ